MCTLIVGVEIVSPRTLLLGANRDEDPARPSDPPAILHEAPRVVGGRDRVAGGTWLAIAERRRVVAMLNRRPSASADRAAGASRSRGLLALDVAAGKIDLATLPAALRKDRFAPFSMLVASPERAVLVTHEGGTTAPRVSTLTPGWHVITHADLDDAAEPRTAWLLSELASFAPESRTEAWRRLTELLSIHGGAAPAVCLHEGPMVTVSSALVWLGENEAHFAHAEGRPCMARHVDYSPLLADRTALEPS